MSSSERRYGNEDLQSCAWCDFSLTLLIMFDLLHLAYEWNCFEDVRRKCNVFVIILSLRRRLHNIVVASISLVTILFWTLARYFINYVIIGIALKE